MCDSLSNLGFHVSKKGGKTASARLRSSQHQLPITGKHGEHSIIQASILKRHLICHPEKERMLHGTTVDYQQYGTMIVIILSHFFRNNAFYCKFQRKPILGLCNHFPRASQAVSVISAFSPGARNKAAICAKAAWAAG